MTSTDSVAVLILEDRHTDVAVELYRDPDEAVERARRLVAEYGYNDPDDPIELPDDCLFSAPLSGEGDHLSVVMRRVRR